MEVIIATARQAQEMVARFVSCLVFYVNSGSTPRAREAMVAEVRAEACEVARWGWTRAAVAEALLRPVEAEMVARFGPAKGLELSAEFAGAFLA